MPLALSGLSKPAFASAAFLLCGDEMFELSVTALLTDFVVALVIGAGWTFGCWLMARILGVIAK